MDSILRGSDKPTKQKPSSKPKPQSTYPYLGIDVKAGLVVMFTMPRTGFVVHSVKRDFRIGEHSTLWNRPSFERVKGTIILRN